jgi:hypothetical protein
MIGKDVPAGPTTPTAQPDRHAQDRVIHDQPQAAATQLMRGEWSRGQASGARLSVTDTNRTPLTYRGVMFLDFAYSGGPWQFDTDDNTSFGGRSEDRAQKRTSFLLFHARVARQRHERGGVLDRNLQGRGKRRDTGRGPFRTDYPRFSPVIPVAQSWAPQIASLLRKRISARFQHGMVSL